MLPMFAVSMCSSETIGIAVSFCLGTSNANVQGSVYRTLV